ncbi:TPA: fimbrial protein [Serratia fonticola]
MKKLAIVASIVAALGSVSAVQAASTGTITFNGTLTSSTCSAAVDGKSASEAVKLPTIGVDQLASANLTQGRTGFNINLTGCTGDVQKSVSAYFESGTTVDNNTGRLINTLSGTGAAKFVELQLLDGLGDQNVIKAGNISQQLGTTYVDASSGTATLPYLVQYYSTGTAEAGEVSSSVVYSLQYK